MFDRVVQWGTQWNRLTILSRAIAASTRERRVGGREPGPVTMIRSSPRLPGGGAWITHTVLFSIAEA